MTSEKINVKYADKEHVWIGGEQFVSLNRFHELRSSTSLEMRHLMDEVAELTKENEALKVLLKKSLMDEEN